MTRTCGDCIVCCVYPGVKQLGKPAMTHCPHLRLPGVEEQNKVFYTGETTKGNCKIYESSDKPECCSGYSCSWLCGYGEESDRPDKSLMLFDRTHNIENAVEGKPLRPNHEISREGIDVINRMSLSTGMPIIVTNFYERRIQRIVGNPVEIK